MRIRQLLIGAALVVGSSFITTQVISQDAAKHAQDAQEMMEKWLKYSTPGEHHQKLNVLQGEWTATCKHWHDPASQPEVTSGTASFEWVLGNRFLAMDFAGEAMGQPFEGMGVLGYDNFRKQYVSGWIDSMNTGIMTSTGTADPAGKKFTFTGKMDNLATGQKDVSHRAVLTVVSNDKIVEEMYHPGPDGKEIKAMEITYTRSK